MLAGPLRAGFRFDAQRWRSTIRRFHRDDDDTLCTAAVHRAGTRPCRARALLDYLAVWARS